MNPDLGYGVGLRAAHYPYLRTVPPEQWGVDWFEAITEDFLDGSAGLPMLERVRASHPVVLHGVSLNIGSTDELNADYLRKVAALADRIEPVWISDHLCWTGVDGINSHDLWPVPLTTDCLTLVSARIQVVQDYLGRPLVLENPSSYFEWQCSHMPEWEFLGELVARTGCKLLLDVNNTHVSSVNHGFDPTAYVCGVPADSVAYIHLAGSTDHGTHRIDTHDRPVGDPVWPLYQLAQQRTGGVSTLLEWDANIPPFPAMVAELAKARGVRAGMV